MGSNGSEAVKWWSNRPSTLELIRPWKEGIVSTIRATFHIVTPMFLGGARGQAPELRPPSIKGALRFWWRASSWGRCLADAGGDVNAGLRLLHSREGRLFGSAAVEDRGGQGVFRLRAFAQETLRVGRPVEPRTGQAYLLGQGLFDRNEGCTREALLAGQRFDVLVGFRRNAGEEERGEIERALLLWGMLGGLGSRSRKGYGSIALEALEGANRQVPQNLGEIESMLPELVDPMPTGRPPLTAFSTASRIDCSLRGPDPMTLLEQVGTEMKMYRSWGLGGSVEGVRGDKGTNWPRMAEGNFPVDHDYALAAATGEGVRGLPTRIIFGLPHSYYFSSAQGARVSYEPQAGYDNKKRRASPLLIHIHRFPDRSCAVLQSLLPALFLPQGLEIAVKSRALRGRNNRCFEPEARQGEGKWPTAWAAIVDYLDRFKGSKGWQEVLS